MKVLPPSLTEAVRLPLSMPVVVPDDETTGCPQSYCPVPPFTGKRFVSGLVEENVALAGLPPGQSPISTRKHSALGRYAPFRKQEPSKVEASPQKRANAFWACGIMRFARPRYPLALTPMNVPSVAAFVC